MNDSAQEINRVFSRSLPNLPDPDLLYELFRSKTRARVYFYLLKYGHGTVRLIGQILREPYNTVYRNIRWLHENGFIEKRRKLMNERLDGSGYTNGRTHPEVLWGIAREQRVTV